MSKLIATAVVALAIVGGTASANAGTIQVHGYQGTAYGSK